MFWLWAIIFTQEGNHDKYLFVNKSEICSKSITKTPELWTYFTDFSSVSTETCFTPFSTVSTADLDLVNIPGSYPINL